jgi:large subunit ribosomal protein L17
MRTESIRIQTQTQRRRAQFAAARPGDQRHRKRFRITTVPKAKAIRPLVDKMITLAKEDTLHSRRQAAAFLRTPASVKKLFDKLGTKFGQRNGGYTRIVRLGWRKGDGAELAKIELVGTELVKRAAERAKRREERLKAVQEGREHEAASKKNRSPGTRLIAIPAATSAA